VTTLNTLRTPGATAPALHAQRPLRATKSRVIPLRIMRV
jgi:hypothetical protein